MQNPKNIRNIAVIAHVDHGKTTLVDGLLKQSNSFRDNQAEMSQALIMDSGDQERERGITITAKVTSVSYSDYRINIIDTPGHADFSGEIERTLNMADGVLLIVDAQEGPMPQTKFVLAQALGRNLKPLVIINKIDKPGSRVAEVENELSDLFLELAAHEDQLSYPVYYAIGRDGKAWNDVPDDIEAAADLSPIFEAIVHEIPAPDVAAEKPFQMLVTALEYDNYKGKCALGKVSRGSVSSGQMVALCKKDGSVASVRVESIIQNQGTAKVAVDSAVAGDIVLLSGLGDVNIGETVAAADAPEALPVIEIEAPTLSMYIGPNTSPFKGREGSLITGSQIGSRLRRELETNIGLRVEPRSHGFLVSGRGELHLSVLVETMRREGFELELGRPEVVTKLVDGKPHEPVEELVLEVPAEYAGAVQMELGTRRAVISEQFATSGGATKLVASLPTRLLLGLRGTLLTKTKGTVTMYSLITGYEPQGASLKQLRSGVLIAHAAGTSTPYALQNVEARGVAFIGPAEPIYEGQIVGLSNRGEDIEINVCRAKQLTNMRSSSSDGVVQLTPPTRFSLEECIDFIEPDEMVEVTPSSLRLRKSKLTTSERKSKSK